MFMSDSFQWKVPIAVSTRARPTEPAAETLLEEKFSILVVGGVGQDEWIKVSKSANNLQQ